VIAAFGYWNSAQHLVTRQTPENKTPENLLESRSCDHALGGTAHRREFVAEKKVAASVKKGASPTTAIAKRAKEASAEAKTQTTITLKQIAAELAEAHALPKKQAEAVLADLIATTTRYLKKGEKIRLAGLGILQVQSRPARTGRNPATGAPIQIAASKKVAFRAAKELKEAI
jgi:DNA-binding protein HU-beta